MCLLQNASLGHLVSTGTLIVGVDLEFHSVAGVYLHTLDDIAHVNKEDVLLEDIIVALCLLCLGPLGLHHLLDFLLNFARQFAEGSRLDPAISFSTLKQLTCMDGVVNFNTSLLGMLFLVLRTDLFLSLVRKLREGL